MPQSRGGEWEFAAGEVARKELLPEAKAENRGGHKPLDAYKLPKWVQHPDFSSSRKFIVEKQAFVGMAADGSRNYECWNVAHVAAFHDDLKLLSLATKEQCMESNRWGMTPAHMCCYGVHATGPALCALYELIEMGAVDPTRKNFQGNTPWHLCQKMHGPEYLKVFEKVMYKGHKPENYDEQKAAQLRPRGKFARNDDQQAALKQELHEKRIALEQEQLLIAQSLPREPRLPVCLVFPGQGSQMVGMLKNLKDLPTVREMLDTATSILGYDLLQLCLEGPEEKLAQTVYCQPAMFVAGMAAVEQLKIDAPEKVSNCQAVAGLSLGEYTALAVAGVFDFPTGLRLVKARGEAMERETTKPGAPLQGMLSVAGLEEAVVSKLCKEIAGNDSVCQIANFLFPKGFSVAGHKAAIEELEPKVMDAGAMQAKILKTSGAFHTPLMMGARDALMKELEAVRADMRAPTCQVYMNVTSKPIGPDTTVDEIIEMLGNQLISPVRWDASMLHAIEDGCSEFFECGPNKQLKSMMKRIKMSAFNKMQNIPA